jgi:intein-encoded DNA endonuclease-like protein
VLIYRKINNRLTVYQDVQASVEKVIAWCDEKGSNINPTKAVALWCSLDNRILRADVPAIKIND